MPIESYSHSYPRWDTLIDTGDDTESDPEMAVEINSDMVSSATTRESSSDPFVDSPGPSNTQMNLENDMQRRLFFDGIPFIEEFSQGLRQIIDEVLVEPGNAGINYSGLAASLREASAIPNVGEVRTDYWELRNRARIWKCCERIIEKM